MGKLTSDLVQSNKLTWADNVNNNECRYVEDSRMDRGLSINTVAIRVLFDMVQDLCERIEKLEAPDARA